MKTFWKKKLPACLLALALLAGTVPMASAASADLTYDVDEDSGVWLDADDFQEIYEDDNGGYLEYVEFTDYDDFDDYGYFTFEDFDRYGFDDVDSKALENYEFYYDRADADDYDIDLDTLRFETYDNIDSDTLDFDVRLYGDEGSFYATIRIDVEGGSRSGSGDVELTYKVDPGDDVTVDAENFWDLFDEEDGRYDELEYVEFTSYDDFDDFGYFGADGYDSDDYIPDYELNDSDLDDAMFYYNERGAGWGIKESGIPREEIWVTSKISGDLADAQNAFEGMLKRLQVDYIDLVYIHHPAGTLEDILACWRVMENEYKAGRIRALGISNFDNRMEAFNYVMQNAEIKPQVAQIECHPLAQRKEARQLYADNYDIQVECWYPLNHNRGDVNNAILRQIATAHGKSVYQIILRWHMQEGLCPVPGSTNPDHILENISIFDFELSDEEMSAIRAIDLGDAGRSFNISYGNGNFGNFQDYTYDHTYTPTAIESVQI